MKHCRDIESVFSFCTVRAINSVLSIGLIFGTALLSGCSSTPETTADVDPTVIENRIFSCKQNIETQKKKYFSNLSPVLKRLAGENQVLREFNKAPHRRSLYGAIGKFPLEGDSGGLWRSQKDAQQRTVSTRFEIRDEKPEDVSISFGQPGRVFTFPISKLKRVSTGLRGQTPAGDSLEIKVFDENHLLITAIPGRKSSSDETSRSSSKFTHLIHALVRTYGEQSYAQESKSQVSDYPVTGPGLDQAACE